MYCEVQKQLTVNLVGHSEMFYHIYEKVKVDSDSLEPHLWSYRQRISLEHIGQTLREKKLHEVCPVLHEFLQLVFTLQYVMLLLFRKFCFRSQA